MKLWKSSMLIVGVVVLLLSSLPVTADESVTEETGDVYHWIVSETGGYAWEYNVGGKPNIDITKVSSEESGDQVIVSLEVDSTGVIQDSERIMYYVYYTNEDTSIGYWFMYSNGNGLGWALSETGGNTMVEVTASDNTLSCTFDKIGESTSGFEFYGVAYEYTVLVDLTAEYWVDYAPDSYFEGDDGDSDGNGGDGGGDGGNGNGTPGFELLAVIAALGAAFIILRRRK